MEEAKLKTALKLSHPSNGLFLDFEEDAPLSF